MRRLSDTLPALLVAALATLAPLAVTLAAAPAAAPGRPALLLLPPGQDATVRAAAAGGLVLARWPIRNAALVAGLDAGFPARIGAEGSALLVDAGGAGLGCGQSPPMHKDPAR